MRKRPTMSDEPIAQSDSAWLDLCSIAEVEISSEAHQFPIEAALAGDKQSSGWRAGDSGEQVIRLLFDQPQTLKRIVLEFYEPEAARTQEFLLRWSSDGVAYSEIVRQQWNFSPKDSSREREDYKVNLAAVSALELRIIPDISSQRAIATLKRLRLA